MPILPAVADLEAALQAATPTSYEEPEVRDTGLRHSVLALHTETQEFRRGRVETVTCEIRRVQTRPGRGVLQYNRVKQHAQDFVRAIKDTQPGRMKIYWPTGILVEYVDTDEDVAAIIRVALCDEYPVA